MEYNLLLLFIIFLPKQNEALTFKFIYFDNTEQDFASRGWLNTSSLFQKNIAAVGARFGQYISGPNIELIVHVEANRGVARAAATFNVGTKLGKSTKTGLDLYEPSSLSKLKTGLNRFYNHEIIMYFNAKFVEDNYWLDPTPDDRDDIAIPNTKVDFLSIVLHEIGHGLGYAGTINSSPGINYGKYTEFTYVTVFDERSSFGGDGKALDAITGSPNPMYFNGPVSEKVNGGQKVRLTNLAINDPLWSQNFYHLGDCSSPPILEDSLMSGCYTPLGPEYIPITCVDMAILADLGYTMTRIFNETCLMAPTAPIKVPTAPVKTPTAPVKAPSFPINTPVTAPITVPSPILDSTPVKTPTAPVKTPTVPINAPVMAPIIVPAPTLGSTPVKTPTVPINAPNMAPIIVPSPTFNSKCGLLGFGIICFNGCGIFRRLLGIGGC